jgi:hypothetical protein
MRIILASSVVAILAIATPAFAGGPAEGESVLVVPFTGAGTDDERDELSMAAVRGIRSAGATAELAQSSADDLIAINGCTADDSDCLARIPAALGVDAIVFGKVRGDGAERQVILVRIEPDGRARNGGAAAGVEAQAAELFGVKRPESAGSDDTPGGDTTGGDDKTTTNPFAEGYTGDLGGGSGALDRRPQGPETNPTYGRRDGGSLDLTGVERYSWGLVIGGGAAVGVGAILLLIGDSVQGSIDDAPTDTADDLDDLESLEGRARVLYGFGNTLAIGGLVTAAVGGALVLYQASRGGDETEPATEIGVAPLRGGAVFTVEVRR